MRNQYEQPIHAAPGNVVIHKRMSVFSVAIFSLAMVLIAAIGCATALAFHAIAIVDRRVDTITVFATDVLRTLPEITEALPPALADAIDDERRTDYLADLTITSRIVDSDHRGRSRGVVTITNDGDRVVSLLSLRVVGLDSGDTPVWEDVTWGATPIQIDDEWRGPLLPGVRREIPVSSYSRDRATTLKCEVTDIRLWRSSKKDGATTKPDAAGNVAEDRGAV